MLALTFDFPEGADTQGLAQHVVSDLDEGGLVARSPGGLLSRGHGEEVWRRTRTRTRTRIADEGQSLLADLATLATRQAAELRFCWLGSCARAGAGAGTQAKRKQAHRHRAHSADAVSHTHNRASQHGAVKTLISSTSIQSYAEPFSYPLE